MDDAEVNTGLDDSATSTDEGSVKSNKPKRRSLVERELETSLTSKITSPIKNGHSIMKTSRYGRAQRTKLDNAFYDTEKALHLIQITKNEKSPIKTPYKNRTSKSPATGEKIPNGGLEGIYNTSITLSCFGSETKPTSPAKKHAKVYVRKDLIQTKDEETASVMKSMFSPTKISKPSGSSTHLNNILERSSEKYNLNIAQTKSPGNQSNMSSIVKTLDFDTGKKKKKEDAGPSVSKSDLFQVEAKCEYQVGDLAWSRVGSYPFWPCIVTREPHSELFVKVKMFGRVERDLIHVTFFGDNGRRGWIPNNMLRKFRGQLEFENTRNKFTPEDKKKDPRLYAAFFVSDSKTDTWNIAVEEAESFLREPKRLRIDHLHEMLSKIDVRSSKAPKSSKVCRTDSDVSLSESLYDTLFSEDDSLNSSTDKSRKRSRNTSLDVSEIVTACIDNMASKTGMAKIQKQSHMDKWLQKAKSKTPEKTQTRLKQTTPKFKANDPKHKPSLSTKKSRKTPVKSQKKYSLRKSGNESLQLEQDYNQFDIENENPVTNCNGLEVYMDKDIDERDQVCGIGIISKVETLCEKTKPITNGHIENNEETIEAGLNKAVDDKHDNSRNEDGGAIEPMEVDDNALPNSVDKSQNIDTMLCDNPDRANVTIEDAVENCTTDNDTKVSDSTTKLSESKTETELVDEVDSLGKPDTSSNVNDNNEITNITESQESNVNVVEESTNENVPSIIEPQSPTYTQKFDDMPIDDITCNGDTHHVSSPTYTQNFDDYLESEPTENNKSDKDVTQTQEKVTDNIKNHETSTEIKQNGSIPTSNKKKRFSLRRSLRNGNLESNVNNTKSNDLNVPDENVRIEKGISLKDTNNSSSVDNVDENADQIYNKIGNGLNITNGIDESIVISNLEVNEGEKSVEGIISGPQTEDKTGDDEQENVPKKVDVTAETFLGNSTEHLKEAELIRDSSQKQAKESLQSVIETAEVNVRIGSTESREIVCHTNTDQNNETLDQKEIEVDKSCDKDQSTTKIVEESLVGPQIDNNDVSSTNENHNAKSNQEISMELDTEVYDVPESDNIQSNTSEINTQSVSKSLNEVTNETENKKAHENQIDQVNTVQNKESGDVEEKSSDKDSVVSSSLTKVNGDLIEISSVSIKSEIDSIASFDTASLDLEKEGDDVGTAKEENSRPKRKQRTKPESKQPSPTEMYRALDDPEFVKYLELRQDALLDETPDISQDDVVKYLYKTWVYEQNLKSDMVKTDDIEQSNLVKGLGSDNAPQPKRIRKKAKVEKEEYKKDEDVDYVPKEKPKRRNTKQYYNEEESDVEDEVALFEIFKNTKKIRDKVPSTLRIKEESTRIEQIKAEDAESVDTEESITNPDMLDDVELYFADLTKPKPNLFKGLMRERICDICYRPGHLVKCKGLCHGMFHPDCVKREAEQVAQGDKKRKKKEKRGRKPKARNDSDSHSDEKDANVSQELTLPEETIVIDDVDDFEAKFAAKMQEMLSRDYVIELDSASSSNGLTWKDTVAGKCEIVDVNLKIKQSGDLYENFKCNNCTKYDLPLCSVCRSDVSPKTSVAIRHKCHVAHCHKYYHVDCLEHWPQTQYHSSKSNEVHSISCPRHVCHTCVSDDPRGCKTRFSGDKLARCIRCPATYHSFTKCLPAGTEILNASHVICPRHYENRSGNVPRHVNTGWCFICALGGTLICCEYCPTSFHADCLNIKPPEGGYMCEECETGRLPLYGEMVWVKLGHYRWWPGLILHPSEIPTNLLTLKHSLGEFVVRFFGQYDHYWVNRGRVFPFQEGDSGKISSQKSKIDEAFQLAMEHAHRAFAIVKAAKRNLTDDTEIQSSLLPPHYVKLKVNKPVGSVQIYKAEEAGAACDCPSDSELPCGPLSQCLNRMLLTECGPWCAAGDKCLNRAFERREYPNLRPGRTYPRGWGLYTLEDIHPGQFVIEYVGELIDMEEFNRRMKRMHEVRDENFYFLTLDKDRMIDAGPKGNLARFMNHSCDPNCETQKWTVLGDVRVGLFAIKFIPANTEVTFNYNLECAGIEKKPCMCGSKRCSGYIGAKPKSLEELEPKRVKRVYKKRVKEETPTITKSKVPKPRTTMRSRPKELTEIEKDLLIIKNATNGISSDSEGSRLSSVDTDYKLQKPLKRKRVSFCNDEKLIHYEDSESKSAKKLKLDGEVNGER